MELPVKTKAKARRIEKRTIFIFQDGEKIAIRKRPAKGLLAGCLLYTSNKELLDEINKVIDKLVEEGKIEEFTANHVQSE